MTIMNVFKPSAFAANSRNKCSTSDENLAYLRPRYDIADQAESFLVSADLPGVGKQDLGITLHDGLLEVIGKRLLLFAERLPPFRDLTTPFANHL